MLVVGSGVASKDLRIVNKTAMPVSLHLHQLWHVFIQCAVPSFTSAL